MADISKTVEIVFGGKNELSKTINTLERDFSVLNTAVSSVVNPLAKIGEMVLKADAALAAMAVGGMALAIRESSNFNSGFGLISTSVTATGEDLNKFKTDILNYATTSVKSINDINAAIYTAAQAGIDYKNSLEFMSAAEQLAVANKANLNTTVDLLTGTMKAYGYTVSDIGRLNDIFFTSTLIGKQTIDELGQSMGHVTGIAANSGVSFEDLSAAIATLTAKSMNTAEAITAVRAIITTIVSPSKEAADAARALGIDLSLTSLSSQGFADKLTEIITKTGGSKEELIKLFSEVRAMNGVLSLAGDGMAFFNEALDKISNSAGSAAKAYEKMVGSFENLTQQIVNQAKVLLVDLGDRLEPMAVEIGGGLSALISSIKVSVDSGAFDPLFTMLDNTSGHIAEWLKGVAAAFPEAMQNIDFQGLIDAFSGLGDAIGEYFGGLDLTTAEGLSSAIQTVIDVVAGLINITSGMADAFRPFVEQAVGFLKAVAGSGTESQEAMGKVVGFAMAIQNLGLGIVASVLVIDEYKLSIAGIFNTLAGGIQIFWNGFQILIDSVKAGLILVAQFLVELFDRLTFGLIPQFEDARKKLTSWAADVSASFWQNGNDAGKGLDVMLKGIGQLTAEAPKAADKTKTLTDMLNGIPKTTEPKLTLKTDDLPAQIEVAKTKLEELPEKKQVGIEVLADGTTIEQADGLIKKTFPDGSVLITNVELAVNKTSVSNASSTLKKEVPDKKAIEIEAKLDVEKIKATAAIIEKSLEWKAKVDIAQIEASAKIIEATFKNVDTRIESTGSVIEEMIKSLTSPDTATRDKWSIERLLADEAEARKLAMEQSAKLTEQQIELNKLKLVTLERGDAMIKISADGLKPHLEMILWEIMESVQIRANESGSEFLLGV